MSDMITAKAAESTFRAHPEGQFVAQCIDCIDLGEKVQDFPGTVPYLAPTCAIVFRTGERNEETGEFIDVSKEYTVSMGEKANLRKDLTQWRGKAYTQDQIDAGVPLDKLTGNHALLTVSHRTSGKGKTYANITAIVGIPKQMAGSVEKFTGYVRDEWWAKKKEESATAADAFRAANAPKQTKSNAGPLNVFGDVPGAFQEEDDTDLPF